MANTTRDPVKDAVRVFNKHILNPVMLHLAGRKNWYASVVHHTGRHTGKAYATPVVAELASDASGDWLVIPLPYGTGVDWLRNVLAAGTATVRAHGRTYDAVEPVIIDAAAAAPLLSASRRRTFQRFGIGHFLRLRRAK